MAKTKTQPYAPRVTVSGAIVSITRHLIPAWYAHGLVYMFRIDEDPVSYATTAPRFQHVRIGDTVIIDVPATEDGTQEIFDGSVACRRIRVISIVRHGEEVSQVLQAMSKDLANTPMQAPWPPDEDRLPLYKAWQDGDDSATAALWGSHR